MKNYARSGLMMLWAIMLFFSNTISYAMDQQNQASSANTQIAQPTILRAIAGSSTIQVSHVVRSNPKGIEVNVYGNDPSKPLIHETKTGLSEGSTLPFSWNIPADLKPGMYTIAFHYPDESQTKETDAIQVYSRIHRASQGFSNGQGQNQWSYLYQSEDSLQPMRWNQSDQPEYDANQPDKAWVIPNSDQTNLIQGIVMQPGTKATVRRFLPPVTGQVRISGTANLQSLTCGDGVGLKVMNGNEQIWPVADEFVLPAQNKLAEYLDFVTTVTQDQPLDFWVSARNHVDGTCERTEWSPKIEYDDQTAPSVPSELVDAGSTTNSNALEWSAVVDGTSVGAYDIFRDGTLIGHTTTTSYTDTGLNPATKASYQVRAVDVFGHASEKSQLIELTTASISNEAIVYYKLPADWEGASIQLLDDQGAMLNGFDQSMVPSEFAGYLKTVIPMDIAMKNGSNGKLASSFKLVFHHGNLRDDHQGNGYQVQMGFQTIAKNQAKPGAPYYQELHTIAMPFIDAWKPENEQEYFQFTASESGTYRFFTSLFAEKEGANDTLIQLYRDPQLTELVASGDDVSNNPYGKGFSLLQRTFESGKTYYLVLKTKRADTQLKARIQVEKDSNSDSSMGQLIKWDDLKRVKLRSLFDQKAFQIELKSSESFQVPPISYSVSIRNDRGRELAVLYPGDKDRTLKPPYPGKFTIQIFVDRSGLSLVAARSNQQIEFQGNRGAPKPVLPSTTLPVIATPGAERPITFTWTYAERHDQTLIRVYNSKKTLIFEDEADVSFFTKNGEASWDGRINRNLSAGVKYDGGRWGTIYFARDGQYTIEIFPVDDLSLKFSTKVNVENIKPVIFVPGIAGTFIYRTNEPGQSYDKSDLRIWPPPLGFALSTEKVDVQWNFTQKYALLDDDGFSKAKKNAGPASVKIYYDKGNFGQDGVVDKAYHIADVYVNIINRLNKEFERGLTAFYVPWDWRKALEDRGNQPGQYRELLQTIEVAKARAGTDQVVVLSHSMGGLLTKTYLYEIQNSKDAKIRRANDICRWISVATPYEGSPKSFRGLIWGYNFGNPKQQNENARKLVRNFSAVYELMSTKFWSDIYNGFFEEKGIDLNMDGLKSSKWVWKDTVQLVKQNYNFALLKAANDFHDRLRTMTIPKNLEQIDVVGSGYETTIRYKAVDPTKNGGKHFEMVAGNGDGVVPLTSLMASGNPKTKRIFVNAVHHGYMFDDNVEGEWVFANDSLNTLYMQLIRYGYKQDAKGNLIPIGPTKIVGQSAVPMLYRSSGVFATTVPNDETE